MTRLRLQAISKAYPTVLANDQIDLAIEPGEIHAILGENGAGKSTLVKMIYGVTAPTSGRMFWEGQELQIQSPAHARALGIAMVFQHFSLFETLTVTENALLSTDEAVSRSELAAQITMLSERYGLPIDPARLVHDLSVGERQRVEIIRCLLQKPKLLIMDEPTSVLPPQAVTQLFETLRKIRAEGCSILYISHKLDEIQALCDTATILRGGRVTGTCRPAEETPHTMATLMIGKDLERAHPTRNIARLESVFRVHELTANPAVPFGTALDRISFSIQAGQILGIAGVSGNGQQELLALLSGERLAQESSSITLAGEPIGWLNPAQRRDKGLCSVPEDRLGTGAVPSMTLSENMLLTATAANGLQQGVMLDYQQAQQAAQGCIDQFDVKCSGPQAPAQSLSGGNLQKFIMGREILQKPRLLICAQPTWGVDVGAASFLHESLIALRDQGAAILLISEDLDELFEICDAIAVMAKGRLSPIRDIDQTNPEEIGLWMSGLWHDANATA